MRGLDVFGGFFPDGSLYLMGEIGTPFEERVDLPARHLHARGPHAPGARRAGRLLEATYGPGWKVPDPAFHFETPRTTVPPAQRLVPRHPGLPQRLGPPLQHAARDGFPPGPAGLAEYVAEQEGVPAPVVDVGAGRGADALWFARQGASVTGLDFAGRVACGAAPRGGARPRPRAG